MIFAFFGWIFETTAVFVLTGHFTDRGFFFIGNDISRYIPFITGFPIIWGLPIIDMYGIAGLIIVSLFYKIKDYTILLFFLGIIAMTIFELIGSYWCQYVLHKTYWNYSNEFMNFQGRISLRSSITWGFLTLFVVKYITPKINNFYNNVTKLKYFKTTINILILCFNMYNYEIFH